MNTIAITNNPVDSKILNGRMNQIEGMIARKILPEIEAKYEFVDVKEIGAEFLRIHDDIADGGSETAEITYSLSKSEKVFIKDHRLKMKITKDDAREYGSMTEAKRWGKTLLMQAIMTIQERGLSAQLENTAVITQQDTLSGTDQWSDKNNSDPIGDIELAKNTIYDSVGMAPNTMIMSWKVFQSLRFHPQVADLLGTKYGGNGVKNSTVGLTIDQIKGAFDVKNVLIGEGVYNTAKEGQTKSMSPIWGKHCWLAYINPNPNPNKAEDSLGYTFWGGMPQGNSKILSDAYEIKDPPKAEFVRVEMDYAQTLLKTTACYLIKDAIA